MPADPERIVLLATSAWRRYAVSAELDACRALGVPAVVVTGDPQVTGWARGLRVMSPAGVRVAVPDPWRVRLRRTAGRVRRRLRGAPAGALPPRGERLRPDDVRGATLVVTDCQSMPTARRMLETFPRLRARVELDRGGRLAPPPDSGDDE